MVSYERVSKVNSEKWTRNNEIFLALYEGTRLTYNKYPEKPTLKTLKFRFIFKVVSSECSLDSFKNNGNKNKVSLDSGFQKIAIECVQNRARLKSHDLYGLNCLE